MPSSSIIGLVDTFTPGPGADGTPTAKANDLVLITSEREAVAAFGANSAITKACRAIYTRAKAVIVACGVAKLTDAAEQTSATDLAQALVKLYEDNAATLTPDPLHSLFYDSHPPAALRVARLSA